MTLGWSEFNKRYFSADPTVRWQQIVLSDDSGFLLSDGRQVWRVKHHPGTQSTCTLIEGSE